MADAQPKSATLRLLMQQQAQAGGAQRPRSKTLQALAGAQPEAEPVQPAGPSMLESAGWGAAEGATLGYTGELVGAARAFPARDPMDRALPRGATPPRLSTDQAVEKYRAERDETQGQIDAAREANPKTFLASQVGAGVATAAIPGAAPATLGKAMKTGATLGGAGGLGASKADLTRGEFGRAAADTTVGALVGAPAGAAGYGLAKGAAAAIKPLANKLKEFGRAKLFKAAVGQNKRAFMQVNSKELWDDATQYLDEVIRVGPGDSVESIGEKLSARAKEIDDVRDGIVRALDAESGAPAVSPFAVAQRIEKELVEPLKKLVAKRGQAQQAEAAIDEILELGKELSFADAAAQRRAFQDLANYDRQGRMPASEEVNRRIAQIWNNVIDEAAEPLLKRLGSEPGFYKAARQEQALVMELLGHVNNRIAGNAANRTMSPSDHALGGVGALMTGNPFIGVAAAASNHAARTYGNAAAGRGAINIAKMAAASPKALEALVPSAGRAAYERQMQKPELGRRGSM